MRLYNKKQSLRLNLSIYLGMSCTTFREPSYITLMHNPTAKISGMQMSAQILCSSHKTPIGKMIVNPVGNKTILRGLP